MRSDEIIGKIKNAASRHDVVRAIEGLGDKELSYPLVIRAVRRLSKFEVHSGSLDEYEKIGIERIIDRIPDNLHLLNATEIARVMSDVLCIQANGGLTHIEPGLKKHFLKHLDRVKKDLRGKLRKGSVTDKEFFVPGGKVDSAEMERYYYSAASGKLKRKRAKRLRTSREYMKEQGKPKGPSKGRFLGVERDADIR